MTPTMVLKDGKLLLVLGSPGGSTIITTVANDMISFLENGLTVQQSADAPRFHHQYLPDRLDLEKSFPRNIADQLKATGYDVNQAAQFDEKAFGTWGDSELIAIDPKTGLITGGHDSAATPSVKPPDIDPTRLPSRLSRHHLQVKPPATERPAFSQFSFAR